MIMHNSAEPGELFSKYFNKERNYSDFIEGDTDESLLSSDHTRFKTIMDVIYPELLAGKMYCNSKDTSCPIYVSSQNHTSEICITDTPNKIAHISLSYLASEKFFTEALAELEELDDYATEEELSPPSPITRNLVRKILRELTLKLPRNYSVSLWEDGDVVIYSGGAGWRVSIYCRANGGAALYVNTPDGHDYESQYQLAQDMPLELVIDALEKIPA